MDCFVSRNDGKTGSENNKTIYSRMNRKIKTVNFILLLGLLTVHAQLPDGYYNDALQKKNAELKTALHHIIHDHTELDYYGLSNDFRYTDWHPDGYFWDMYSNTQRTSFSGMNREHNLPKSWWSTTPESTYAYSDLHNLYPSDAAANSAKGNLPLGEVGANPTFDNGVVKTGSSNISIPGYRYDVFEPAGQYKGDFARDYMYMVTCYQDYSADWRSVGVQSMLVNNAYPTFTAYAADLLLKWHTADPVSKKETDRNNEVYRRQGNRNPFVDFPILAEYIWGKYRDEAWNGTNYPDAPFYLSYDSNAKKLYAPLHEPKKTLYKIYSLSGTVMQTGYFSDGGTVDVAGLGSGLYIVLVYTGTQRKAVKTVINNGKDE
jgi:endonuclease I